MYPCMIMSACKDLLFFEKFCLPQVWAMKRIVVLTLYCNFSLLLFPSHRFDYLQITDSSSNIIGTYCGNQTGKSVRVVGTVAVLIFHTDGIVQSSGFELSFSFFPISPGRLLVRREVPGVVAALGLVLHIGLTSCTFPPWTEMSKKNSYDMIW